MKGLLWYDPDPKKTLETKIAEAAQAYRAKYGQEPNACMVSLAADGSAPPACQQPDPLVVFAGRLGIALERSKTIQPNHMLIGVDHGIQTSS